MSTVAGVGGHVTDRTFGKRFDDPFDELRAVSCSNGAPSARNLLVTVFGDALLPHGATAQVSVRSLARLLRGFGVNERLVRTSLTRLVNEGLLVSRSAGRRSFYQVAPDSRDLFARADRRIYGAPDSDWDGSWTIVVVDATESTAERRAVLRQELAWAGLGAVAPNVMASPLVAATTAADVVARVGGFRNVLVSRSRVVAGPGTLGAEELARRCAALDEITGGYAAFVDRFERFDPAAAAALEPETAFKLRTLLVASYRKLVLADPLLPAELLPDEWIGGRARHVAAVLYDAVAERSEAFVAATVEPMTAATVSPRGRFVDPLGQAS